MNIPLIEPYLQWTVLSNSGQSYAEALLVFLLITLLLKILAYFLTTYFKRLAQKTDTDLDDLIVDLVSALGTPFYAALGLYAALKYLTLTTLLNSIIDWGIFIVITFYAIQVLSRLIEFTVHKVNRNEERTRKDHDPTIIELLGTIAKVTVWLLGLLFLLSNLGFNVTSLVAGLGVGGIAVAFALQNILSDIFSSFSIYFDKPFQKGDFIIIGKDSGTVKKVGIKSTRIQTLQGEELIVPNRELTTVRIQNFKTFPKRRVIFTLGITYSTPRATLEEMPGMIKECIVTCGGEFDRAHFTTFGDSAFIFEVVYFVPSGDGNVYFDLHQKINFALLRLFEEKNISLAHPTRTIITQHEIQQRQKRRYSLSRK